MEYNAQVFTDSLGNTLEFCLFGSGNNYLICYPGFGESYKSFEKLSKSLSSYTLVAINLYFIGASKRYKAGMLSNEEWKSTFFEFLHSLRIDRFSVLGFSLGGRFALSTFESFHDRMDQLILVAPDGVRRRFTYELATFPLFLRQLFWLLMKYPKPYFLVVDLLAKSRLVNSFVANFSKSQMGDHQTRMTIYNSWVTFKHLKISNQKLLHLAENGITQCTFIFGNKDKIISIDRHSRFLSKLSKSNIHVLPFGHNKLVDNAADTIRLTLE